MRRIVPSSAFGLLVLSISAGLIFLQDPLHYPWVVSEINVGLSNAQAVANAKPAARLDVSFLGHGLETAQACQLQVAAKVDALRSKCPACVIRARECLHPPTKTQRSYLSNQPTDQPVALHSVGVVIFESLAPDVAVAACRESQLSAASNAPMRCVVAKTPKPSSALSQNIAALPVFAALMFVAGMLATWLGGFLLIRYKHLHEHLSHDSPDSGPQKVHVMATPRVGGVTLFFALVLVDLILLTMGYRFDTQEFGLLMLAALPVFLVGLAEDVTKKIGVLTRLGVAVLAASVGAGLLGAIVTQLDIPGVDGLFQWTPVAVLFTLLAVAGIANAFNIIDGNHGLAGSTAVIALLAMGFIAWRVGDPFVMCAALAMAGALLGFLHWNWPHGRIFLGDGGAYLVGFWLAELAVLLVVRNEQVSPWFPFVVLIYPIFETIYSIVRRKILGDAVDAPDALHLHQIAYRLLLGQARARKGRPLIEAEVSQMNSMVAGLFGLPNAAMAIAAVWCYANTLALVGLALLFCTVYVATYKVVSAREFAVSRTPPERLSL